MKKGLGIIATMAAMAMVDFENRPIGLQSPEPTKPKQPIDADKLNELRGLKKFVFIEGEIWAINKKNAIKKANKLGWISPPTNG